MSYSASVTAANKSEAKAAVVAKLDEIVSAQSIHARDRDAAIDLLIDDDTMHVTVTMNGSVGWREPLTEAMDDDLTSASISASISASASLVLAVLR